MYTLLSHATLSLGSLKIQFVFFLQERDNEHLILLIQREMVLRNRPPPRSIIVYTPCLPVSLLSRALPSP